MLKTFAAAASLTVAAATIPAFALADCAVHGNTVVLTVAGAVEATNRGPFDEGTDRFHAYRGNAFDKAHAFTLDELSALPRASVRGEIPYGAKVYVFDGPTLADVLKAAGVPEGRSIALQALDGYEVEVTPDVQAADSAILALCRNGTPLGLGGLGPTFYIVPLAEGASPTQEQSDRQVWGLHYIGVR